MIRFVVLSTQRSGSGFLRSLLKSHPSISCLEELFLSRNTNPITYRSYRTSSMRRALEDLLVRDKAVCDYLAEVYARQPANHRAVGFKLMYGQAERHPEVVEWCRRNGVKIVHLVRRNMLKMIVSRHIAAKRRVYHSTRPLEPKAVRLNRLNRLNIWRLPSQLRKLGDLVEANRQLFSSMPYLEVVYEDCLTNQEWESRRILEFLECDPDIRLVSDLVKTSPDSLEHLIENYDDIRRALTGTPFEAYLA